MDVSFTRASTDDLPALLALMQSYYAFDGHEFHAKSATRALGELLGDERLGLAWLIRTAAGETVGYMALCIGFSLELGGRDAFVDEIYLEEGHRGRGIGRQALSFMIDEARRLGIKALHLEVDRENARARALYRALGFEPRERFTLMSRKI